MNKIDDTQPVRNHLLAAVRLLQRPAGDDPKFGDQERLAKNLEAFLTAANAGFKALHLHAIREILTIEATLRGGRAKPREFAQYLRYLRKLWRRLNDSLFWVAAGFQRHVVKRVCGYRDRADLSDSNPSSIMSVLDHIYRDPLVFAIWNDATSLVDIGDITLFNKRRNSLAFAEVKEGRVNDAILTVFEGMSKGAEPCPMYEFLQSHGSSGARQVERFTKQQRRNSQVLEILRNDEGHDPFLNREVQLIDPAVPLERYDRELQCLIEDTRKCGDAVRVIDGCLALAARLNRRGSAEGELLAYQDLVRRSAPGVAAWAERSDAGEGLRPIAALDDGLDYPTALPLFLLNLPPDEIVEIVHGDLRGRITFAMDWDAFGELVVASGGSLTWSGKAEGRRQRGKPPAERLLTVGDRIPTVVVADSTIQMGGPTLTRMMFDLTCPKTIAAELVKMAGAHRA